MTLGRSSRDEGEMSGFRVKLHCRIRALGDDSYLAEYLDVDPRTDFATNSREYVATTLPEAKAWCEDQVNSEHVGGADVRLTWVDRGRYMTADLFL